MSSPQGTPPPRSARAKQQHPKSAALAQPVPNGNPPQKRPRGNRKKQNSNGNGQQSTQADILSAPHDPAFADGAVLSSEEVQISTGPRNAKKHTQSQPSTDRIFSPTHIQNASLTDTEAAPSNPSATPAKTQGAYAGPTFHASPAPSALPIPKFLSRSVPAKPQPGPPTPPAEDSDSTGSPTPSPSRASIPVPPRHENSPLDALFQADRQEKARRVVGSPVSVAFAKSPAQPSTNIRPSHTKHPSQNSLNAMFPIELDTESRPSLASPPTASPGSHRAVTAPSRVPQVQNPAPVNNEAKAMQELLDRLAQSAKKPTSATPPRTGDRVPSEPSSRHHTPSPFYDGKVAHRSTSGPTTPAPSNQESSDFFYGNRNLSPLFKAAKNDSTKRNSGLRTEITADSPILPHDGFAPVNAPANMDSNAMARSFLENSAAPMGPRRGSTTHIASIPPFKETPNIHKPRTPGRRSYHSRPDSYPNRNGNAATNGTPFSMTKASTTMSFIPSSVQAKQHSTPKTSSTPTKPPQALPTSSVSATARSDPISLEQELKRMLNLQGVPGVH
ncbi:hypothetical protein BDV96DRAFT_617168 [Lophiotrema nucula]|uniref:Proteophosphoglycan 5 n=1 Tax=Lophiotrema nucula TaxID=690887 RepID=A0A6A5YHP4_9PLEO|nr:hypothetical protein BDV96DRAFT_617168 [Lophiotrema nucula]